MVILLAGILTIASVILAVFVSKYWLMLGCFVGFDLIASAITGLCSMSLLGKVLGVQERDVSLPLLKVKKNTTLQTYKNYLAEKQVRWGISLSCEKELAGALQRTFSESL